MLSDISLYLQTFGESELIIQKGIIKDNIVSISSVKELKTAIQNFAWNEAV